MTSKWNQEVDTAAVSGTAAVYSKGFYLQDIMSYNAQVYFDTNVSGTLRLAESNDTPTGNFTLQSYKPTRYTPLPSGTEIQVAGSGTYMFNREICGALWSRVEFTPTTTGIATMQTICNKKG